VTGIEPTASVLLDQRRSRSDNQALFILWEWDNINLFLAQDNGVKFQMEDGIKEYRGTGKVEEVLLNSGKVLPADVVVQGVGTILNTEFLAEAGLSMTPQKAVLVNEVCFLNNYWIHNVVGYII